MEDPDAIQMAALMATLEDEDAKVKTAKGQRVDYPPVRQEEQGPKQRETEQGSRGRGIGMKAERRGIGMTTEGRGVGMKKQREAREVQRRLMLFLGMALITLPLMFLLVLLGPDWPGADPVFFGRTVVVDATTWPELLSFSWRAAGAPRVEDIPRVPVTTTVEVIPENATAKLDLQSSEKHNNTAQLQLAESGSKAPSLPPLSKSQPQAAPLSNNNNRSSAAPGPAAGTPSGNTTRDRNSQKKSLESKPPGSSLDRNSLNKSSENKPSGSSSAKGNSSKSPSN